MFRRGERVEHDVLGPGTVVSLLVLRRAQVRFDRFPSLPFTMQVDDLSPIGAPARPTRTDAPVQAAPAASAAGSADDTPATTPAPGTSSGAAARRGRARTRPPVRAVASSAAPAAVAPPVLDPIDRDEAWQTLEALRLGVVPARGVREYTVARDRELAAVDEMLHDGHGCRVVWGDYGAGKTHLLEAAEQLALERGYAVARVTLDPTEHGLQHPLRLYRAIAERVRTLHHAQPGIEHILERLVDSAAHNCADGACSSRFFSPFAFIARHGEPLLTEKFTDYVRGEPVPLDVMNQCLSTLHWRGPRLLAMSDFRTYGRMYVHLVSTLAVWCKDAGLAGLALFFDEFERVEALSSAERYLALDVFRHYAALLMDPKDLAFDPERLYRGGQDVHKQLPLRFRHELPLVGMFALTPLGDIEASYRLATFSTRYDLRLSPLARRDVLALVPRLASLYRRAYPDAPLTEETVACVNGLVERTVSQGSDTFRGAVRAAVFAFDAARAGRLPATLPTNGRR
jgi:hypothetical protein